MPTKPKAKPTRPASPLDPPPTLSPVAASWWRKIVLEHQVDDSGGRLLLEQALQAFDRLTEARARLAKDGSFIQNRFHEIRPHPALQVERDSRAALLAALKALALDLEPLRPVGRPPGR